MSDDHLFDQFLRAINEGVFDPPKHEIELRDAYSGQKLGMTKKQYKRYVLALGTDDQRVIMRACQEVRERRAALNMQDHDTIQEETVCA